MHGMVTDLPRGAGMNVPGIPIFPRQDARSFILKEDWGRRGRGVGGRIEMGHQMANPLVATHGTRPGDGREGCRPLIPPALLTPPEKSD